MSITGAKTQHTKNITFTDKKSQKQPHNNTQQNTPIQENIQTIKQKEKKTR